jgi:hypothetical protein
LDASSCGSKREREVEARQRTLHATLASNAAVPTRLNAHATPPHGGTARARREKLEVMLPAGRRHAPPQAQAQAQARKNSGEQSMHCSRGSGRGLLDMKPSFA